MPSGNNRLGAAVIGCSIGILVVLTRGLLAPVCAGVILASGLRPIYFKFPFNRIRSVTWRKHLYLACMLLIGLTLASYVFVAGARVLMQTLGSNHPSKVAVERDDFNRAAPPGSVDHMFPLRSAPTIQSQPATQVRENPTVVQRLKSLLRSVPGMDGSEFSHTWDDLIAKARELGLGILSTIFANTPALIFQWAVFILTYIFISLNFEQILMSVRQLYPQVPALKQYSQIFEDATHATLLGTLLAGLCQASLVSIGMGLAGFSNYVLLGLCAFFASFVPYIGVAVVWGTALIYAFTTGNHQGAIIIIATGCISALIDNLVIPTFVGSSSHVHPLILFVSILGAVDCLGVWGLFIGPVLAIFTVQVIRISFHPTHAGSRISLPEKVDTGVHGHGVFKE